jgi:L-rhamnose mutarotase
VLLVKCLKVLEVDNDKIDFLTPVKTKSHSKYIKEVSGLNINEQRNLYAEYYDKTARHMETWQEVYDDIDVSHLKDYKRLYIMGGLLFPSSGLTRYSKHSNSLISGKNCIKWVSVGIQILHIIAMHKAHVLYDIPLHEFSLDTDELSSNLFDVKQNPEKYFTYHIYDMPSTGKSRLDAFNYYLLNKTKTTVDLFDDFEDKQYDFTMGWTVFPNGNRSKFSEKITEIADQFKSVNLFTKDKVKNIDNSITIPEYLKLIEKSKFTYILPSYDNMCFSLYRFIEAIDLDCLPLLHPECYVEDVQKSFDVDFTPLFVNTPIPEESRLELLKYYKEKLLVFEKGFAK